MAKRSREHRQDIPGYDDARPSREERKQQHRADRHATNQMLHSYEDPDDIVLPRGKKTGTSEPTSNGGQASPPEKKRFRVWKTKFWKRRDGYQETKAAMDAEWPVITPEDLPED